MGRLVKQQQKRAAERHRAAQGSEEQVGATTPSTEQVHRIGPGRPPKRYQWKPGQSGNPTGKRKDKLADDVKALFERALNKKVKFRHGERAGLMTKLEAGLNELASQFAEGDSRARRDVFDFAVKLGIDLAPARANDRDVSLSSETELRQALLDRGIPARLLPPIDEAGLEPPPDPPVPAETGEEEDEQ